MSTDPPPPIVEAQKRMAHAFIEALRRHDGLTPAECDEQLNSASQDTVARYRQQYGTVWLGQINPYSDERKANPLWEYKGEGVHNFGASFVVPAYEAELERLLLERLAAPYTGMADDKVRIDAIFDRIEALGGTHLHWS